MDFVVLEVDGGRGVVFVAVARSAAAAAVGVLLRRDRLQHRGHVDELVEDVEHALSFARRHFLRVARERDRLEVVVGQVDVAQRRVGDVLDVGPSHSELTAEPVVRPNARFSAEVDAADHLGDAAELAC